MAVAWDEPASFADVEPWALALERFGVAGFGWGVAWLGEDGRVHRHRRPTRMAEDPVGRQEIREVRSTRFLIHLRRPSRLSTAQVPDTQPFLQDDGAFAICHNGMFERDGDVRVRFDGRLAGRADSEVGFRYCEDLLDGGTPADEALRMTHRDLGGFANLGYLGADGQLLVYAGYPRNAIWRFGYAGAEIAATGLHSMDDAVFDLVFTGATGADRVPPNGVTALGVSRPAGGTDDGKGASGVER